MIFHITTNAQWQKGIEAGRYLPVEFDHDGFIHCSKAEQIVEVGNRYYAGVQGLILLKIDFEKLTSRLVFENLLGGEELFPHIYGLLNLEAVIATADFPPNPDGTFSFPEQWVPINA